MKRITDPDFKYTSSLHTNIRKLFAKVRREQQAQREATANVTTIKRKGAA